MTDSTSPATLDSVCGLLRRVVLKDVSPKPEPVAPHTRSELDAIFGVAMRSKLDGAIAAELGPAIEACRAGDLRETVRLRKGHAMVRNSMTMKAARQIDALLRDKGIRYAVMKGPIQQRQLYGDFYERPSGDVDVLVDRAAFKAAADVLVGAGFERTPSGASLWWDVFLGERHFVRGGRAPAVVDLHHRLQQPGSPQPRSSARFLDRARPQDVGGASIVAIADPDVPLLSAMSLVKGFFNREPVGNHAFDLFAALHRLGDRDGTAFRERAAAENLAGTASMALRVLHALFPADIPIPSDAALPGADDHTLRLMVLVPDQLTRWVRRRDVLIASCARAPFRIGREWLWLAGSEAARRLDRREAASPAYAPPPEVTR